MSGITFLDNAKLADNTVLNMRVLTNNIKKVQKTANKIANDLKIKESAITFKEKRYMDIKLNNNGEFVLGDNVELQDDRNIALTYNTKLLNYVGINEENASQSFRKSVIKISVPIILIVAIVSLVMLYSSFKMTYSERIRELAMLSSLRNG
ncbi:MAG: hypothetical protein HFJ50_09950 [Clostridia bacterium]|jgi:ABC-type antimicrobial peptide transport system permease subunit|nr:hypothetical protein [Clostridia bacterium]